ncbi:LacI family DNA-binding transcriptional regulator [Sphaerochaeta sp.]|jgi:DNA-binding LacI/PurR family transcriptional regulator|uniref:LacI family DNA-binding transcriptional regulator n=1 Tax=Sphaerochaeta sp. TaxID=1972642 RepID=UPI002586B11C|nr:LacI family DNA-binding transcriptional regulator [Sphaerochaeta sp.]MDD3456443.1 LacI family DNA-binding transcriptional regulator [Sphaerochaeta sp.]
MASNIYDVAKAAKVSISTVSRVINNPDVVSSNTRDRVKQAMDTLNFVPNSLARSLTSKTTQTIGVVVADITNPYYAELLRSIQDAGNEIGYSIISCNSHEDMERERRIINTFLEKQVDMIMLVGGRGSGDEFNKHVYDLAKQVPVILCNEYLSGENLYCVVCDKAEGTHMAVKHLLSLGHTRIAFINGGAVYKPSLDKMKGYRKGLREAGLPIRPEYIQYGDYHLESGSDCVAKLLSLKEPPTAIITSNDLMALGAIKAIQALGRQVPKDISIIGFDDIYLNNYITPALTSVRQKLEELGRRSVSLIPLIMEGKAPAKTIIHPELILRQTCSRIL